MVTMIKGVAGMILLIPLVLPTVLICFVAVIDSLMRDNERLKRNDGASVPKFVKNDEIKVKCTSGEWTGAIIVLKAGQEIIIGRDNRRVNLVLSNPKVSRLHCKIKHYPLGELISVTNYSTNGTFMNGKNIKGIKEEIFIERNTFIKVGIKDIFHIE